MKENESISWHPSFAAALQLELQEYESQLNYIIEYPLTNEPLKVDVIILKSTDKQIDKNIAHLFRKYNIVEYKSPKDYLSVDDFYKAMAYAYLYKYVSGGQEGTDSVAIDQMTLTLVSMNKPTKLLQHLQHREKEVYLYQEGIYYIEGTDIPIQLVIQSELPKGENEYLTLLTDQLNEKEQLQDVLMDYLNDNKNQLYRLIFHAIFEANPSLFMEVLGMQKLEHDPEVQRKIDELVREFEWDKKWKKEGIEEGELKAQLRIAINLLYKGMSLNGVAEVTGLPLDKLKELEK